MLGHGNMCFQKKRGGGGGGFLCGCNDWSLGACGAFRGNAYLRNTINSTKCGFGRSCSPLIDYKESREAVK